MTSTPGSDALVVGMLEAYNERRFSDFAAACSSDAVIVYPQSGERFVGRENILAMVEAFPSPPTFAVKAMHTAGDMVVVETDVDYGEGALWKAVILYTIRGEQIASETAYFAAPFEAAAWRAPFRAD